MKIAFFGSSLLSSWWNGACTYYRGIIRGLADRGHHVTFYEPDAFGRQEHRDVDSLPYADVVVYEAGSERPVREAVAAAAAAGPDAMVKASGVGVHDALLEALIPAVAPAGCLRVFWDVDAPATLDRLAGDAADPLRSQVPEYDVVLTYGGGPPVVDRYCRFGARRVEVVYNALDPATHHRVPVVPELVADCTLLANRLPDREDRIEELFVRAARLAPDLRFLLGGNGWEDKQLPPNVQVLGHVGTEAHNAVNSSAKVVLNVTRESMAANGWSPPTRVFEAAGAGACLLTDSWQGIDDFLRPGREVLVADTAEDVVRHARIDPERAAEIGRRGAARVLAEHTYERRAGQVERLLLSCLAGDKR